MSNIQLTVLNNLEEKLKAKEVVIISAIKANETRFNEALKKDAKELAILNDYKEPIISSAGLHAPYDGYIGLNENLYLAGQFIPRSSKSESYANDIPLNNTRIKIPVEVFDGLTNILQTLATQDDFNVSLGSSWEENGLEVSYLYIYAHAPYIKAIEEANTKIYEILHKNKIEGKGEALDGRQAVRAKVLTVKTEYSHYYGASLKMLVELENKSTAYGTVPKAIQDVQEGEEISFTATFEVSGNDETHAFYSRPSKASKVS